MPTPIKPLGVMVPLGGGDPIPLTKDELVVGRRPTNDVRLDFENVSGKHCVLRFVKGIWHVRDLGSTNGTTVNGQRIQAEHGLMPDDQLGVATHLYTIDYEPASQVLVSNQVLEDEIAEVTGQKPSLMEMAGLDRETGLARRPRRAPDQPIARPSARDADFADALPSRLRSDPSAPKGSSKGAPPDDDFFKLIEDDVKKTGR